jgi:Uma2 family endonuclease
MGAALTKSRRFEPGTTGWSAEDFDDPEFVSQWEAGRYEIVEGVLTKMSPPDYFGNRRLQWLTRLIERHLDATGTPGSFAQDVDVILSNGRIVRADAVFMTPRDEQARKDAVTAVPAGKEQSRRLRVPPTLIIESVSEGHESHDRRTKRRWYAEFRVPHYWIIDTEHRCIECLVLDGGEYRLEQSLSGDAELRPLLFPGLAIPLKQVWV